jgi:hypothetical protein
LTKIQFVCVQFAIITFRLLICVFKWTKLSSYRHVQLRWARRQNLSELN